jgi:hypothetical protein
MNWKDVNGYEGYYQVSDTGLVKSLARHRLGGGNLKEKILTPRYDKRGYVQFILYKDGKKESIKGHHLVWNNFGIGKRNGRKLNIDHIDENKSNNNISNLRLTTNRENVSKSKKGKCGLTGVYKPKNSDKYQAYITINKKHIFLGSFDTAEQAHAEYLKNIPCEK